MHTLKSKLYLFLIVSVFTVVLCAQAEDVIDKNNQGTALPSSELTESSDDKAEELETKEEIKHNPLDFKVEEVVSVEKITERWIEATESVIEKHKLSNSVLLKSLATFVMLIVAIIIYFTLRNSTRLILHKLSHTIFSRHFAPQRSIAYKKIIKGVTVVTLTTSVLSAAATLWLENPTIILNNSALLFLAQVVSSIFIIAVISIVIFEIINATLESVFSKYSNDSGRVVTLIPIIKNTVFSAFFLIVGLTVLSELGVNVLPLLAGAGVIGFAIGFGSQTLVKDLITGFIIIIEDLFQVGDVVKLAGKAGLVEKITIRKVQLRDLAGIVYTIPFSEISVVENLTKDFSFYLLDIGVAYREDTDKVIEILREVDTDLRADPEYAEFILEALEILGVDQFSDSAVIIKARIKTLPIKQWMVGREFNRRMKYAFDHHDIEIPFPHKTIYFGESHKGDAPPAKLRILENISD